MFKIHSQQFAGPFFSDRTKLDRLIVTIIQMIFSEEAKNREITGFHHELCESRILFTPSTISLSVMGRVCKKPFQFIAILSKQNNCFLSLKSFLQAIFSPFLPVKEGKQSIQKCKEYLLPSTTIKKHLKIYSQVR